MTLGDVSAAQSASTVQVSLQKSQSKQQEAVVSKLIDSAGSSAPVSREVYGTGTKVNVTS